MLPVFNYKPSVAHRITPRYNKSQTNIFGDNGYRERRWMSHCSSRHASLYGCIQTRRRSLCAPARVAMATVNVDVHARALTATPRETLSRNTLRGIPDNIGRIIHWIPNGNDPIALTRADDDRDTRLPDP